MRPSLCLLLTMSTSTPPFTAGLPLTGMHLWAGWVWRSVRGYRSEFSSNGAVKEEKSGCGCFNLYPGLGLACFGGRGVMEVLGRCPWNPLRVDRPSTYQNTRMHDGIHHTQKERGMDSRSR